MIGLLLALGCGELDPFERVPADAAAALASCDEAAFPELATTCRVEAAARAGLQGRADLAEAACDAIESPTWKDECHFRAGEEFGRTARVFDAVRHCKRAGNYQRFCLTHLGWHLPADQTGSAGGPEGVKAAWGRFTREADAALDGADAGFAEDTRSLLAASFGFGLYYGSGSADPALARAILDSAPPDDPWTGLLAPALRQGFADEAVRLRVPSCRPQPAPPAPKPEGGPGGPAVPGGAGQGGPGGGPAGLGGGPPGPPPAPCWVQPPPDLVASVRADWAGAGPPPTGAALPPDARHGRYHPPINLLAAKDLGVLPLYGGDRRYIAVDPDVDLTVAILQAMYFHPDIPADAVVPFLADPAQEVRWAAAGIVRTTPSPTLDHPAVLTKLAASDDPGLAEHGRSGLEGREWTVFVPGAPPRRGPPPGEKGRGPPPGP